VISLGTLPSLAISILPSAVSVWRQAHALPLLRVVEKNQLDLLLALARAQVDFIVALTERCGCMGGMRQRVLFRARLDVLALPGHPALALKSPSWRDLAEFPWSPR
jgi:DNA-binding transcriptional LysR family regulator